MNLSVKPLLSLLVLVAVGVAQQPNQFNASQTVNGQTGAPYPITGVGVPMGVPSSGIIAGLPIAQFVTFEAGGLAPQGYSVLGNQLFDLDGATTSIMFDGLSEPGTYVLDGTGQFQMQFQADPPGVAVGSQRAWQSGVVDPTSAMGASMTAASEIVVVPGITTFAGPMTDDGSVNISLAPFNFGLPFYTSTYSDFFVSANGFLSFTTTTTDFTSTPTEMLTQMPRIALFWCDLSPNQGGMISIQVDESTPIQVVRVIYDNVPEFGAGPNHTVDMSIDVLGNIQINSSAFNPPAPTFTMLTGISPGGNLSPTPGWLDIYPTLSGTPLTSAVDEAIFEWFGTSAAAYWTGGSSNPYDLTGRSLSATAIGGGQYYATSF